MKSAISIILSVTCFFVRAEEGRVVDHKLLKYIVPADELVIDVSLFLLEPHEWRVIQSENNQKASGSLAIFEVTNMPSPIPEEVAKKLAVIMSSHSEKAKKQIFERPVGSPTIDFVVFDENKRPLCILRYLNDVGVLISSDCKRLDYRDKAYLYQGDYKAERYGFSEPVAKYLGDLNHTEKEFLSPFQKWNVSLEGKEPITEQGGTDQPATAPESKLEGNDKPQPEPKVLPR